jgi:hypothetical protein
MFKPEWENWIEEAIKNNYIKYYDYKGFSDLKEIGLGGFGRVHRAKWKNTRVILALKSLKDTVTAEKIVNEVIAL